MDVLLVDDNPGVLAICSRVLRKAGHRVDVASTGEEALGNAADQDLLITDFGLPDMSGVDLANTFAPVHPDAGVLLMSGYPIDYLEEAGLASEHSLLLKPFTPTELCDAVEQMTPS